MKKHIIVAIFLALTIALTGCSSSGSNAPQSPASAFGTASSTVSAEKYATADSVAQAEALADEEAVLSDPSMPSAAVAVDGQKMVYTVDLQMQTTEFDSGVDTINSVTEAMGGFVEQSYVEGRSIYEEYQRRTASMTVRVPAEKLSLFVDSLKKDFNVVGQRKYQSNISASYYDTQARLKSLRIQEERLLAMLEGATELQYMLEVEQELSNITYQIESLTSSMQRMDSAVSQSTVNISLEEVFEYDREVAPPMTFSTRVSQTMSRSWIGFVDFCQSTVLFFIATMPFWIFIILAGSITFMVVRSKNRNKQEKNMKNVHTLPVKPEKKDLDDDQS